MFPHLATVNFGQPFLNFPNEPLVIAHKPLDGFAHQRFAVAALFCGHSVEFSLKLSRNIDFHTASLGCVVTVVKVFASM